jgi:methylated-DNA-[protein]-cysteine S-methyltransferase
MRYAVMESPIGQLLLAGDEEGLREVRFLDAPGAERPDPGWQEDAAALAEPIRQLREYFAGKRLAFDLPLAPEGTAFQQRVWEQLAAIPPGRTATYGEVASALGRPGGARAVGLACGRNPLPIVIPCHRVIGSDGKLTGFGGGLRAKERLLAHERRQARLAP